MRTRDDVHADKLADAPYYCPCPDAMLRYKKRGIIGDDFREWIK